METQGKKILVLPIVFSMKQKVVRDLNHKPVDDYLAQILIFKQSAPKTTCCLNYYSERQVALKIVDGQLLIKQKRFLDLKDFSNVIISSNHASITTHV